MTAATNSTPILEARGLTRSFGAVRALDNADFDVHRGEVVALIGDNGAGKSTMVKALSGNLALDSGTILFEGREVEVGSPKVTQRGDNEASVTFRQNYRSDKLTSSNTKTLELVKAAGRWQIREEKAGK